MYIASTVLRWRLACTYNVNCYIKLQKNLLSYKSGLAQFSAAQASKSVYYILLCIQCVSACKVVKFHNDTSLILVHESMPVMIITFVVGIVYDIKACA